MNDELSYEAIAEEQRLNMLGAPNSPLAAAFALGWREAARRSREHVARWMIANGFATGHGDSIEDLLRELCWQVKEK